MSITNEKDIKMVKSMERFASRKKINYSISGFMILAFIDRIYRGIVISDQYQFVFAFVFLITGLYMAHVTHLYVKLTRLIQRLDISDADE